MKNNIYILLFAALTVWFFKNNMVMASVDCDFGNNFEVVYHSGQPSPSNADCTLNITNDESNDLSVISLQIDSSSMAFERTVGSNASDWSCSYTQLTPAPNFTRRTICTPNNQIILSPNDSANVGLRFWFEDTSSDSQTVPNNIGLTNIVLNGVVQTPLDADLGGFDWHITAVDDNSAGADDIDFGIIKGYIYFDDNHNDKKDPKEEGVEDVKIKLRWAGPDGRFDTSDDKKYKDRTNKRGKYKFKDLASGRYKVQIEDGEMMEFYLTAEKDKVNGRSIFELAEGETKKRDFGYDRDRDHKGHLKNHKLEYLKSGFTFSVDNIISYIINLIN